ncbi:hypothetical protein Trydic_g18297, partial [Trypoxylus dichotomus]
MKRECPIPIHHTEISDVVNVNGDSNALMNRYAPKSTLIKMDTSLIHRAWLTIVSIFINVDLGAYLFINAFESPFTFTTSD